MSTSDYKKLNVWNKSIDLVTEVYNVIKLLPQEERYALSDQIRRCVCSIPSNIAEGQARNSDKEFIRFLNISNGSLAELETQIFICVKLGYLQQSKHDTLQVKIEEIGKMLRALIRSIESKHLS